MGKNTIKIYLPQKKETFGQTIIFFVSKYLLVHIGFVDLNSIIFPTISFQYFIIIIFFEFDYQSTICSENGSDVDSFFHGSTYDNY